MIGDSCYILSTFLFENVPTFIPTPSQAKPLRAYPKRYLPGSRSHAAETPSWLGGAVLLVLLSQPGLEPKDQREGE